jgi:hypothetical protein
VSIAPMGIVVPLCSAWAWSCMPISVC